MDKARKNIVSRVFTIVAILLVCSCRAADDNRIPSFPVSLNLASASMWDTYGVTAFGDSRTFIKALGEPRNFPYTDKSATGYGGLLVVSGVNPYTSEAGVPMVYDLSCPVEAKPDIRVRMQTDADIPFAVCPVCGSHYDVVELGGAPTSGPARSDRYSLRRYDARPGQYGGYYFTSL